jgi:hypothetical protein
MTTIQEYLQIYIQKLNQIFANYGGYISLLIYIILAVFIFLKNPYGLISKYQAISIVTSLALGFMVVNVANFAWRRDEFFGVDNSSSPSIWHWLMTAGGSLGVLLMAGLIVYSVFLLFSNFGRFLRFFYSFSFYIFLIAGLGIVYKFAKPYFEKTKTPAFIELIKNIVFYIPCLLINVIENIAGTKRSVWILLLIEVIAILAYFGIPIALQSRYLKKGTVLASIPQHLNGISSLDSDAISEIVKNSKNTYSYGLSADIWIDPQPTSTSIAYTRDTNILSFGDRLRIEYNGKTPQKLIIKAKEGLETVEVAKPDIPLQRWNKIVLNYDHGTLDVFLNGELIHSQQNVPYSTIGSIESGSRNGIHGGIRDIRFFDKPITKNEMYII